MLGKVIWAIEADFDETINLLRKTSFGHIENRVFDQLGDAFEDQEEVGLRFPKLVTEIEGPALQIVPIAIFT